MPPLNFIDRSAYVYPDRCAVIHGRRHYNWKEVYARSYRLASALTQEGMVEGDTIAVMLNNTSEMIECHFKVPMTHYYGVPIVHALLVNAPAEWRDGIEHKVLALIAAAPPPAELLEVMENIGFPITPVYGLAETYGPAAVCAKRDEWDRLPIEQRAKKNGRQGVRYHIQECVTVTDSQTMKRVP